MTKIKISLVIAQTALHFILLTCINHPLGIAGDVPATNCAEHLKVDLHGKNLTKIFQLNAASRQSVGVLISFKSLSQYQTALELLQNNRKLSRFLPKRYSDDTAQIGLMGHRNDVLRALGRIEFSDIYSAVLDPENTPPMQVVYELVDETSAPAFLSKAHAAGLKLLNIVGDCYQLEGPGGIFSIARFSEVESAQQTWFGKLPSYVLRRVLKGFLEEVIAAVGVAGHQSHDISNDGEFSLLVTTEAQKERVLALFASRNGGVAQYRGIPVMVTVGENENRWINPVDHRIKPGNWAQQQYAYLMELIDELVQRLYPWVIVDSHFDFKNGAYVISLKHKRNGNLVSAAAPIQAHLLTTRGVLMHRGHPIVIDFMNERQNPPRSGN